MANAFGLGAAPCDADGVGLESEIVGFDGLELKVKIVLNGGFVVARVNVFV